MAELTVKISPDPPAGDNISLCFGDTIPLITVSGENIRWYDDEELQVLIHTGNSYRKDGSPPGTYIMYLTQTVNDCESNPDSVILLIKTVPQAPQAEDISICSGDQVAEFTAIGENICWFNEADSATIIHTGDTFNCGKTDVGLYHYLVTQTVDNCVSPYANISLNVHPLPVFELGSDTTIHKPMILYYEPVPEDYDYVWHDNSTEDSYEFDSKNQKLGTHQVYASATSMYGCTYADTVRITLVDIPDNITKIRNQNGIILYPNPVNQTLQIRFVNIITGKIIIQVVDFDGRIYESKQHEIFEKDKNINLSTSYLPNGMYLLRIKNDHIQYQRPFVKQSATK
jgi:hypothetical protein